MTARRAFVAAAAVAAVLGGCAVLRGKTEHARLIASLPPEAKAVGWRECVDCHTTIGDFFAASFHAGNPGCESCHGPGDLHVAGAPAHIVGKAALATLSPAGRSQMCLECHPQRAVDWPRSEHAREGLSCQRCHTDAVHFEQGGEGAVRPPSAFAVTTEFCTQCHAATASDFDQPFHHPVPEQAMGCPDCHSPHGEAARRPDLAAAGGCARCHAAETAPKVFRHAALDEGCGVCHVPHGSPLQALVSQDGNGLCLQCHHEASFPVISGVDHRAFLAQKSRCWDCHVELHGSNSDPTFLGRLR